MCKHLNHLKSNEYLYVKLGVIFRFTQTCNLAIIISCLIFFYAVIYINLLLLSITIIQIKALVIANKVTY